MAPRAGEGQGIQRPRFEQNHPAYYCCPTFISCLPGVERCSNKPCLDEIAKDIRDVEDNLSVVNQHLNHFFSCVLPIPAPSDQYEIQIRPDLIICILLDALTRPSCEVMRSVLSQDFAVTDRLQQDAVDYK